MQEDDGTSRRIAIFNTKTLVSDMMEKTVPPELQKHISKTTLELAAKIESLQKLNIRIKECEENIKCVATRNVLPPNVKATPIGFQSPLLDTLAPSRVDGQTFENCPTIRDAKAMIHRNAMYMQWNLDLQIMQAQRLQLKEYCKKENFVNRAAAANTARISTWKELDLDLSDDELEITGVSDEQLTAKLVVLFKKVLEQAAAEKRAIEKAKSTSATKKEKLRDKLAQKSPEEHFNMAIDEKLQAILGKGKGKGKDFQVNHSAIAAASIRSGVVDNAVVEVNIGSYEDQTSKNGLSPTMSGGTINPAKSRGKGKGKSEAKGKGKQGRHAQKHPQGGWIPKVYGDKGAQPQQKGKSKGKGKGKNKNADQKGGGKDSKGKGSGKQTKGSGGNIQKPKGRGKGKTWRTEPWPSSGVWYQ